MRFHRVWLLLTALLIPGVAGAHEHKMDLYGATSAESGSILVGFHTSLSAPLPHQSPSGVRDVSLVGDLSVHWGSNDRRKSNLLGGLRYTFAKSAEQRHLPFVQVLAGVAEKKSAAAGDWDGALGLGAGFDSLISGSGDSGWGIRAQADYIRHGGNNSARVSVGILKRWH